jgi:hypothetical protein
MISVKMADKDMVDPAEAYVVTPHLHLRAFTAVY